MTPFRLLFVAATPFEIAPLLSYLTENFLQEEDGWFSKEQLWVKFLVTGVGLTHTAYFLGRTLEAQSYNLVINAGIAGAFNRELQIGDVVNVVTERFGDLGVEEADGRFTDVHELGLIEADAPPFQFGILHNPGAGEFNFLPEANGLSVNKVHGHTTSIEKIEKKYGSDIETMEGAAFFMACLYSGVAFLQIRSISNYVESRNRENWNLPLAIERLNEVLINMVDSMAGQHPPGQ